MKLWIDAVAALGSLLVAALAIWGEGIKAWLAPPKLVLQPHTLKGAPALLAIPGVIIAGGPQPARYYHLKVVNRRPWLASKNCRVLLTGFLRRGADGEFQDVLWPVPFPFIWSGEEPAPEFKTVIDEQVVDFGRWVEGGVRFEPRLRSFPVNFDGTVSRGQAIRYELKISASNFVSRKPQVLQVDWRAIPPNRHAGSRGCRRISGRGAATNRAFDRHVVPRDLASNRKIVIHAPKDAHLSTDGSLQDWESVMKKIVAIGAMLALLTGCASGFEKYYHPVPPEKLAQAIPQFAPAPPKPAIYLRLGRLASRRETNGGRGIRLYWRVIIRRSRQ